MSPGGARRGPGDELDVEAGIGLVDVAIDVHVAQRGMLSRLVAAVEAGLVDGGLGIDERTVLIVGDGGLAGPARAASGGCSPTEQGVLVSTIGA